MATPGTFSAVLVPIHRAGWPFVAAFFAAAVILGFLWKPLFWLGLIATCWCAYFFRDPQRVTPVDDAIIVSPADGVIQSINPRIPPAELEMGHDPVPCVAVFMNVFDVHVNRAPVRGTITKKAYHPGQFLNASLDKASELNERLSWRIERNDQQIGLVQIAGLVARRIIGFASEGDQLKAGERLGLIRFGSRCDIYLPHRSEILAQVGQRAVAGETVIADTQARLTLNEAHAS